MIVLLYGGNSLQSKNYDRAPGREGPGIDGMMAYDFVILTQEYQTMVTCWK